MPLRPVIQRFRSGSLRESPQHEQGGLRIRRECQHANCLIVGRLKPELAHVGRVRVQAGQREHEARREVVVEQELQGQRPADSGWIGDEAPLAVGSEGEHGADVLTLEVRKVG